MKYIAITITALGLVLGACGKKTTPPVQPDPAAEQAKADEAAKAAAAVNHVDGVLKGVALYNEHNLDAAFANLADNVVMNNVGDPMTPTLNGREAVMANFRAIVAGFPDTKATPVRVFDMGDMIVVEMVLTGTQTGAFRGIEATNKPVGVATAMTWHFDADNKIDRMDSFFDAATMMMQVGAISTPAEMGELKLVSAPEGEVQIIKADPADANAAATAATNVALVNAWYADFTSGNLQAAADKYWADDFTYTGANEGVMMTGKQQNVDYLTKTMFSMFPDWSGKLEQSASVGGYVIGWSVSTATYKGGMPGVEAKDQKITTHSLDITQVVDGKIKGFTYYGNGLEFMSQLGMIGGAGGDKGADAGIPGGDAAKAAIDDAAKAVDQAGDAAKAAVDDAQKAVNEAGDAAKAAGDAAKAATDKAAEDLKKAGEDMNK